MAKFITTLTLGFLSCTCCAAMEDFMDKKTNPHSALFGMPQVDNNRELEEDWQNNNRIDINGKSYVLHISEELRDELPKDKSLVAALLTSIENIQKKEEIDKDVIGFNLVLFQGKIYTEAFLGENAK